MVNKENSSYSKRLLHLISWGHWFTFFNISAALLISIIFLYAEGMPDGNIGKIYMITNWLSHMAFLSFICFVLTVFPLTLLFPKTKFIRGAASIIFTVALSLLLIDGFTYSKLGYHLNISSSSQILSLLVEQMRLNSWGFTGFTIIASFTILVFELVMSNYAWKHLRSLQKQRFPKFFVGFLITSFFVTHLTHVWADANLQYSVLRQDQVLPFSYPSTAKTLMTKYGLFDQTDYEQRKNISFSVKGNIPTYPTISKQCIATKPSNAVFVVLSEKSLTDGQFKQFKSSSAVKPAHLFNMMDSSLDENAWFSIFYSLPNIYKDGILKQKKAPLLFQALAEHKLENSFTLFSKNKEFDNTPGQQILNEHYQSLFTHTTQHEDISNFILPERLNRYSPGIHVFYFANEATQQYDLFVNALLLAQQNKDNKDIVWISSLGNTTVEQGFTNKQALLIWPGKEEKNITRLTSTMDLQPTLMRYWLSCRKKYAHYGNGKNVYRIKRDRILANTTNDGLMIFKKDKAMFIDHQGNFESYSSQLETLISESANFPLMIDGVNNINQFSNQK